MSEETEKSHGMIHQSLRDFFNIVESKLKAESDKKSALYNFNFEKDLPMLAADCCALRGNNRSSDNIPRCSSDIGKGYQNGGRSEYVWLTKKSLPSKRLCFAPEIDHSYRLNQETQRSLLTTILGKPVLPEGSNQCRPQDVKSITNLSVSAVAAQLGKRKRDQNDV
jgi:hypothetical protein